MRIYSRIVIDIESLRVEEAEYFDYTGEIAYCCGGGGGGGGAGDLASNTSESSIASMSAPASGAGELMGSDASNAPAPSGAPGPSGVGPASGEGELAGDTGTNAPAAIGDLGGLSPDATPAPATTPSSTLTPSLTSTILSAVLSATPLGPMVGGLIGNALGSVIGNIGELGEGSPVGEASDQGNAPPEPITPQGAGGGASPAKLPTDVESNVDIRKEAAARRGKASTILTSGAGLRGKPGVERKSLIGW